MALIAEIQKGSFLTSFGRPRYAGILVFLVLREIRKVFPMKLRNFKLRKMPKLLNSRFPEGRYFLNSDNTELKRSSEINFPVSERHRWVVEG